MPPRRALPNIHNWTKHLESRIAPARSSLVNPSCRIDTRLSLRDGAVKAREIVLIINLGAPLLDGRATHRQRAPREARGKDQAQGGAGSASQPPSACARARNNDPVAPRGTALAWLTACFCARPTGRRGACVRIIRVLEWTAQGRGEAGRGPCCRVPGGQHEPGLLAPHEL